jgi:oligopeptide transport system substrate-binding protein
MRYPWLLIALVWPFLYACNQPVKNPQQPPKTGKGGVQYGGVFSVNEVEDFRSLYPLNITDVTSHRIANQVYEGLLKLNSTTLEITPSIASEWSISEDARTYTFKIRENILFQENECFEDGKGRKLTARDVKYCLDRLCESSPTNVMASFFLDKVTGANEHFALSEKGKTTPEGVSGIKIIDDYTIQIELIYPFSSFLKILTMPACWIYPKEAVELYGDEMRIRGVGTGPFKIKTVKEGEVVVLERNNNYWRADSLGNVLPYLDAVKYTFIKEKRTELMEFMKGNLDMVYELPTEDLHEIEQKIENGEDTRYNLQSTTSMMIEYYGFQHQSDVFNNINVRKAFNYAIDREQIVNFALQGKGTPAYHGIVPPSFIDYKTNEIVGYSYDADKARHFMALAGYPEGKGFPVLTLQLNYGGSVNVQVAEVIQKMLEETLNISVELTLIPRAQHFERVETGKALFWRDGWVADYADPENFLNLLYGELVPEDLSDKSYINSLRYKSAEFDKAFEAGLREIDPVKRIKLLMKADQIAIDDAAIIPLYYGESVRLIQKHVNNFPINPMEYRDFSDVHFTGGSSKLPKS